jgi:class 3 adenylate cyclase
MIDAGKSAMSRFLASNDLASDMIGEALRQWNDVARASALEPASREVAIMFTDMVASVETTNEFGEQGMMRLVETHDLIVGAVLKTHRGHKVKHTGDGIMAVFPQVADGLAAASEIQRQIAEHNGVTTGGPLRVRIGLSSGNPIRKDDDYFGTVVQMASRVCAVAGAGEVALTDAMARLPNCAHLIYDQARAVPLKGFPEPKLVRKLLWFAGAAQHTASAAA